MKRRNLLQAASVSLPILVSNPSRASQLIKTPADYEGPFYPVGERNRTNDLIVGEVGYDVLLLSGNVIDTRSAGESQLTVDIWHADPNGRYKHPRGRGQSKLLKGFLYCGEAKTDKEGRFSFRTYVPGSYSARPANHIHYKIWDEDRELLTSQIYFHKFGGDRGQARTDVHVDMQTIRLREIASKVYEAHLQIVV